MQGWTNKESCGRVDEKPCMNGNTSLTKLLENKSVSLK